MGITGAGRKSNREAAESRARSARPTSNRLAASGSARTSDDSRGRRPGLFGRWSLVALLGVLALPAIAADATAVSSAASSVDPRLGAPFEKRERAVLGADRAPVVVVEISSFKCARCREFHQKIFPRLRAAYIDTGRVQWVMLNAADDPGDQHSPIFALARCALRQGKYWELLDRLFGVAHRPPSFLADLVAKSPLLDRGELDLCLRDRATRNAVDADFAEYGRMKIRGTPTFVIRKIAANGERTETTIAGAQTLEHFQRVLDELLKTP